MITEELSEFADTFGSRLADIDWWQYAVLVTSSHPVPGHHSGRRTGNQALVLVGPDTELPTNIGEHAYACVPRGDRVWVRLALDRTVDLGSATPWSGSESARSPRPGSPAVEVSSPLPCTSTAPSSVRTWCSRPSSARP